MADLMNELSDDHRRQQLAVFWKENSAWIIGGAILAVIMTAGMTFWRGYEANRDMQDTTHLISALKSGDADAMAAFAETGGKDHAAIARFAEASLYAQKKEKMKAVAVYDSIADTSGVKREWRDLAKLMSIAQRFDTAKADELRDDIDDLADDSAWRYSAREMSALLHAREGDIADAAKILADLSSDADAPDDVRTRAATLHELYQGMAATGKESVQQ